MIANSNRTFTLRHSLLSLAVFAAVLVPFSIAQSEPVPVLGYVAARNANPKRLEVFRQGLNELGYVEGKNVRIEYREAVLEASIKASSRN
jgi:putative ABC transport system substrate-binding protein